jgi:hypothetical protein
VFMPETVENVAKKWNGYNGDRPIKTTGSLEPIPGRCGAKLKFTGTGPENPLKYCKNWPSKKFGGDRCQKCGAGVKNSGIANASFKHGSYSKHLPTRMQADVQDALNDPELISLRGAIAVTKSREIDLFKRVDTGEAGAIWRSLQSINKDFQKARAAADPVKMQECLEEQSRLIGKGLSDSAAWSEIHQTIEQRRKLVDSELKRVQALQIYVDASQVQTMMVAFIQQLNEVFETKEQRSKAMIILRKFMGETSDKQKQALD